MTAESDPKIETYREAADAMDTAAAALRRTVPLRREFSSANRFYAAQTRYTRALAQLEALAADQRRLCED